MIKLVIWRQFCLRVCLVGATDALGTQWRCIPGMEFVNMFLNLRWLIEVADTMSM